MLEVGRQAAGYTLGYGSESDKCVKKMGGSYTAVARRRCLRLR
jgi:hypothetical protein